nr:hypothetical protein [Tanacetum cinerariifolium]
MVAYLEKSDDNTEFHQIVEFLSLCSIIYALTQMHAIVDGKAVVIPESLVRSDLLFNEEDDPFNDTYETPCHTKKVFSNLARKSVHFSRKGMDTGGSPRRQETMRDEEEPSMDIKDSPKQGRMIEELDKDKHVNLISEQGEVQETAEPSKDNDDATFAKTLLNIKRRGYKQSYFKGMKYKDIRPIFKRVSDQVHTFVPKDFEIEKEVMKRAGFNLQQESSKKQKLDEQTEEEVEAQGGSDQEVEEIKLYMRKVPEEEIEIDAIPLATKPY